MVAVEPDARMRDELVRNHPGVEAHIGSAESIPLPDASVDAVLAGNAFHWFDQEKAFPEIARVLRPGGVVAALWNDDDARVDWIAGLARIFGWDSTTSPTDRLRQHPLFTDLEHADFRHGQRCTTDSMVARMGTLSPSWRCRSRSAVNCWAAFAGTWTSTRTRRRASSICRSVSR